MKSKFQLALVAIMATATTALVPLAVRGQSSTTTSGCTGNIPDHLPAGTLATMAYQGFLEKQGIPSSAALKTGIESGKVTARQIVEAAIAGCLFSDKYNLSENQGYIGNVNLQLRSLMIQ